MTARFFSPQDIDGSGLTTPTEKMSIDRAILQNTLEQIVLVFGCYTSLIATNPKNIVFIPSLVFLFLIGRILFVIGYAKGATHRACGFAMTFYPTIFGYLVSVLSLFLSII